MSAAWGTEEEIERRNRIRLSVAAYTYEFDSVSIMSDAEFDSLSKKIRPVISTGDPVMDKFFRKEFEPDTGMWIHNHPKLDGLRRMILRVKIKAYPM